MRRRHDLTERELQVVRMIWLGLRSCKIAELLGIAERTVESHRNNIYRKTGVHGVPKLLRLAVDEGWVRTC